MHYIISEEIEIYVICILNKYIRNTLSRHLLTGCDVAPKRKQPEKEL